MIKRPGPSDTEDDLLKFQEDFFSSKQKPSVVVKKRERTDKQRDVVKISEADNAPVINQEKQKIRHTKESSDASARLDDKDKEHISEVLTQIQERDVNPSFNFKADYYKTGFPLAPKLDQSHLISSRSHSNGGKKKSLFAQQFENFSKTGMLGNQTHQKIIQTPRDIVKDDFQSSFVSAEHVADNSKSRDTVTSPPPAPANNSLNVASESLATSTHQKAQANIINDDSNLGIDKATIDKENTERLKQMNEKEILQEKEKLLNSLDPKLLSFLQSKAKTIVKTNISEDSANTTYQTTSETLEESLKSKPGEKIQSESVDPFKKFNIKKDYVNMTAVEKDKLEWMKEVPKVEFKKERKAIPRFDFDGQLMDPDMEVSMTVGLHHHGDDPASPGYSLEELFQMARSNFPQQRVFGLHTLARIIKKYHHNDFDGKLSTDLLAQCLDAGLLFILRWSLDEQSEQIYSAAIDVLACIVYVKTDQEVIDTMMFTADGYKLPSLCTYYEKKKSEMTQEELEEDHDLTDAELIKIDVIKGLLQVQILPRLRYLMEICKPSDSAMINCLAVLIRMAQHNKETAYEVFKSPRTLDVLVNLLQIDTSSDDTTKKYALKLIQVFCQCGRNMASQLVNKHKLDEIIASTFSRLHVISDPHDDEANLLIQTCHLWKTLLSYGLVHELARDMYPAIMSHLQHVALNYKQVSDKHSAVILQLVDAVVMASSQGDIQWSLAEGLFQVVLHCIKTLQSNLLQEKKVTHPLFLSATLRCCSTYYKIKNSMVAQVNPVTLLDEIGVFWKNYIQVILDSPLILELVDEIKLFSDFQSFGKAKRFMEDCSLENLPSYGTHCVPNLCAPSLKDNSPIVLVQALFNLVVELVRINKSLIPLALPLLTSAGIAMYLRFVLESPNLTRCMTLVSTRIELLLLSHVLHLFHIVGLKMGYAKFGMTLVHLYQEIAFQLICLLQPGDEYYLSQIFADLIFNQKLYSKNTNYVLWMPLHFDSELTEVIKEQLKTAVKDLKHIGSMYQNMVFGENKERGADAIESFMTPSRKDKCLPMDWVFYPIVKLYNQSLKVEQSGGIISRASVVSISNLKKCLQFVLLLQITRLSLLNHVEETLRLTRYMCLFLTEGELYKEETLKDLMSSLLVVHCAPAFQSYLDFEISIPGILSFYDLYCNLLQQYLSSSFGDAIFANLLLIPMQLRHNVKYRRALWTEYNDILRIFPLSLKQVTSDLKLYFAVEEETETMIGVYFQALIRGSVKPTWCPLLYVIAVHHVNQYLFSTSSFQTENVSSNGHTLNLNRNLMLKEILHLNDNVIKDDIISYKHFDIDSLHGISKFKMLPPSRELVLRRHNTNTS